MPCAYSVVERYSITCLVHTLLLDVRELHALCILCCWTSERYIPCAYSVVGRQSITYLVHTLLLDVRALNALCILCCWTLEL